MTEYSQQRTDRLNTVIESFQSVQQTGVIKVERSKGGVHEVGSVTLLWGQVVDAIAGGHTGAEALDWLGTWGSCLYAFVPQAPGDISVSPPQPAPEPVRADLSLCLYFAYRAWYQSAHGQK